MHVAPGLEVFLSERIDLVRGKRMGLVSNPTAVLPGLVHALDAFIEHPAIDLRVLFGPEHGLHAAVSDGTAAESGIDHHVGLPVYSLYGEHAKPTPEQLMGIDLLVFDIQDVGARYYTYATTMSYCLEAAAEAGLPMLVLDRPNPINGVSVEGPVLDPEFSSFVGRYPVPIRHGMTIGELARLFNEAFGIDAELLVVPMKEWHREMWFEDTGLTWIAPSPNIPTMDTATVYPGTCLVEGTNVSEGRGTTRPFEWIGAPWIDGRKLARELNGLGLGGAQFRPVSFVPAASKYAHQLCHGVQLHVMDRERFRPVATGLHLLRMIVDLYPQEFRWRPSRDPGGTPVFDRLVGTDRVRQQLDNGWIVEDIVSDWQPGRLQFDRLARGCHLYR
jgi:uncharacterized protein YbbC (DUF1343 family)